MKDIPFTNHIQCINETYIVLYNTNNGENYYYGQYRTLIEALMVRDKVAFENYPKPELIKNKIKPVDFSKNNENPKRYISQTSSGKFNIRKWIKDKTYSFGSYDTLEEAIYYRDYFENKGWENSINERFLNSNPSFIQKVGDKFKIEKAWGNHRKQNRKRCSYGTFNTLEEAIQYRDKCIQANWDASLRPQNPLKYIQKKKGKYWIIKNDESYGMFNNIDDAVYERDLLMKCNWEWDALESIDETVDGEISYLNNKVYMR